MFQLQDELEEIIQESIKDIEANYQPNAFDVAFSKYKELINDSLKRYRHHLNSQEIELYKLKLRFKFETAFLNILTILSHDVFCISKGIPSYNWPISDASYGFDWYTIPEKTKKRIYEVSLHIVSEPDRLENVLSEMIFGILSHSGKRYVGEYYTPLPLAKHLIQLADFCPDKLLGGSTIIDPACGGGIILTEIAHTTIGFAIEERLDPNIVLECLNEQLFGYDIQPFAIVLTKTLLIYTCLPLLAENDPLCLKDWFPHIQLLDPLVHLKSIINSGIRFDFIIGNPPYLSVKRDLLDFANDYSDVLHGHPNLFQLFLWWAVTAAKPYGVISFLIPQSILIGPYYEKLRNALDRHTRITSLTRMLDRKGVVADADQQMMALSLSRNNGTPTIYENIKVRVTRNGIDTLVAEPQSIAYSRVVQRSNKTAFWVVSDNYLDYEIVEHIEHSALKLNELNNMFKCGNGEYVWNQQKDITRKTDERDTVPLVSAASINLYHFNFPYVGTHGTSQRQYSVVTDQISKILHVDPAVLIQRITPRKIGRRLVACTLSEKFCKQSQGYLIENHVIYIKSIEQNLLHGLMGWLNSDAINFLFQLRNGTAHTSVAEVNAIPVNLNVLRKIACTAKNIAESSFLNSTNSIEELNNLTHDLLGISPKQRQRISVVLSRSERSY